MAKVEWLIENSFGVAVGTHSIDEDTDLPVPHTTDPSLSKRAGDLVAGDYFNRGRSQTYKITAVVEPE